MVVSLAGCLGVGPLTRVRALWNGHLCACAVTQHSVIGCVAIIGTVDVELADQIVDLIQ